MDQPPLNFPLSPGKPLRDALAKAKSFDELRALLGAVIEEVEQTDNGRRCGFCAANCEFYNEEAS